jgi:hypothetical protein
VWGSTDNVLVPFPVMKDLEVVKDETVNGKMTVWSRCLGGGIGPVLIESFLADKGCTLMYHCGSVGFH